MQGSAQGQVSSGLFFSVLSNSFQEQHCQSRETELGWQRPWHSVNTQIMRFKYALKIITLRFFYL